MRARMIPERGLKHYLSSVPESGGPRARENDSRKGFETGFLASLAASSGGARENDSRKGFET